MLLYTNRSLRVSEKDFRHSERYEVSITLKAEQQLVHLLVWDRTNLIRAECWLWWLEWYSIDNGHKVKAAVNHIKKFGPYKEDAAKLLDLPWFKPYHEVWTLQGRCCQTSWPALFSPCTIITQKFPYFYFPSPFYKVNIIRTGVCFSCCCMHRVIDSLWDLVGAH